MDKTNIFFLAVGAYVIWWGVKEYQKQKVAQTAMFAADDALNFDPQNMVTDSGSVIDYGAARDARFDYDFRSERYY